MGKFLEASNKVKKMSSHFRALVEIGEVLEKIGSVEQAGEEAEVRLRMLKEAEVGLRARLESFKSQIDLEYEKQNVIHEESMKAEAESKRQCIDMVQMAKAKVEKEMSAAEEMRQSILKEAEEAGLELNIKLGQIKNAESKLAALEAKIEAIKEKARKQLE